MHLMQKHKKELKDLFDRIRLKTSDTVRSRDKENKIAQITSYLEMIHSQVAKRSKKKKLVFVDSGAGNCFLSFLVYYFYSILEKRPIEIHCIDYNERLMQNAEKRAKQLGFQHMHFYTSDIEEVSAGTLGLVETVVPDLCYSLHACDTATDKALALAFRLHAKSILSVSCCQHSIKNQFKNKLVPGMTMYKAFKDRLLYMAADTMRAQLLEMGGYRTDIFEFTSSRYTDKNIMIRARQLKSRPNPTLINDYNKLRKGFNFAPELEYLIYGKDGKNMKVV